MQSKRDSSFLTDLPEFIAAIELTTEELLFAERGRWVKGDNKVSTLCARSDCRTSLRQNREHLKYR